MAHRMLTTKPYAHRMLTTIPYDPQNANHYIICPLDVLVYCIHINMSMHVHVCACVSMNACMHVCMHACACMHVLACMHARMCVYMHACMHACACVQLCFWQYWPLFWQRIVYMFHQFNQSGISCFYHFLLYEI